MMQDLHLKVEQPVSFENGALLAAFFSDISGVAAVRVERGDIWFRFDESLLPSEQLFSMARSSIELLGYHLHFA